MEPPNDKKRDRTSRSKLPASLFSTDGLLPGERFAAWRESIGVIFDVRQPSGQSPAPFNARVESYLLEDILFARVSAGAQKFDRTRMKIAQDSIDHYMIQLFMTGGVEGTRGVKSTYGLKSGGLIAFDFTETMDTFNSDFDLLSIVIPRRRLSPLLRRPDELQGATIDALTGSGKLLANFAATLFSVIPTLTLAEGSLAGRSLIDLVALAFNGAQLVAGDLPELVHHAELMRVQSFIKAHLPDPTLNPDAIAEGVAMSRAGLYRLFQPIGGVAEYVREQRLRRCLADLLTAHLATRQIADIAYSWGFRDPDYFTKAFRQRFGLTPSDARETMLKAAQSGQDKTDERVGDRLYEKWLANLS